MSEEWRHEPDPHSRSSVGYVLCVICPQTWPCDAETERNARLAAEERLANVAALLDNALASAVTTPDTNPPGTTGPAGQAMTTWVPAYGVETAAQRAHGAPIPRAALTGAKE